jgi:hypothetical protein
VLYGLDAAELAAPPRSNANQQSAESSEPSHATLAQRVEQHPLLQARRQALNRTQVLREERVRDLKTQRERYDLVRQSFENLLDQLETDISSSAVDEVRETLQILQPKQAKDLILQMLDEDGDSPEDDVLGDVIEIITTMAPDKLKKILGEFKGESEREQLHRILVAIGELDSDPAQERTP